MKCTTGIVSRHKYEKRILSFQLVPRTAWYSNIRNLISNWSEISKEVRATGICDICGMENKRLEAHEVWEYDDEKHIQRLKKISCVCKNCHESIHIGLADVNGRLKQAITQYAFVNNIGIEQCYKDLDEAASVWQERSSHEWTLDIPQITKRVKEQTGIDCKLKKSSTKEEKRNVQ